MTRFILFAAPRTGSSHLLRMIHSHPDAYCQGEIFKNNAPETGHIRPKSREHLDMTLWESDPRAFAEQALAWPPDKKVVGFKFFHQHNPKLAKVFLADETIHKVILDRPNRFAAWTSRAIAAQTGVFNKPAAHAAAKDDTQIVFDPKDFNRYATRLDNMYKAYDAAAAGPVLRLTYREIDERMDEVFDFLGLPPHKPEAHFVKLNTSNIIDRITPETRQQAENYLRGIGRPEWASE